MTRRKKILPGILAVLVLIQFIRPAKNKGGVYGPADITHTVPVPADVKQILARACNDCHSNNTVYPWYSDIQPLGWWLSHHVEEGKAELNFSEFDRYKLRRKKRKLEEVEKLVKENEMPLGSYTWIHHEAKLGNEDREKLMRWAKISISLLDTTKQ